MRALHPKVRERLRAAAPIVVPPPPRGMATRVLALARRDGGATRPEASPEPVLAAVMLLAMAILLAGLVFGDLPGIGTSSTPDFIEASQFVFSQLLP